jgi:hypothetical protein
VDYKNLGSEEFGGVYESFLALTPQISSDGARFTFAEFAGNERKTSGSYYTPDSLVQCLLDSALDPVVNERLADAERLAKADWPAVEKETQSDPAKRTYVLAFLTKHAGASKTATAEDRKRAWDSVPPSPRRWKLSEEAILAIKVCDMACGSGHFLVGAGHRLARHLARVRALAQGESEPSPLLYQTALRDVIGHCLYGVDINPMAVELCKVTLWLEAMEPGKPLSFLDHHIRCGNSLLGATPELIKGGIPDEAYEAIEGDDKEACSALKKQNKRENPKLGDWFIADEAAIRDKLFQAATAIDEMGDSRPEDIHRKEAAFRNAQQNYDFQKAWDLANLWCAAFVIKKRFPASASEISNLKSEVVASLDAQPLATQGGLFGGTEEMPKAKGKRAAVPRSSSLVPPYGITTQHLRDFVEGGALPDGLLSEAKRLADQYQFFHWHLAFPEVFTQGGFDVFLGNPPWDHVEIKEKEWFAERCPQIASAANDSARKRLIEALRLEQPSVFTQFQDALRQIEGESHMLRNSGAYPLCGLGRINLYAVFAERTYRLRAPEGASGMVMPTGLVTLDNNKGFFKELMELNRLRAFVGFDNEEKTIFPDIDNNLTFAAVTIGKNRGQAPKFCFNIRQFEQLQESDRFFELSSDDLTLLNPNTRTCPSFRSSRDAELTRTLYRRMTITMRETPQETNVWGIRFKQGLFKMATDSNLFSTREQLESEGWRLEGNEFQRDGQRMLPLYEAKMIWHFEHRWASFFGREMTDGRPSRKYVGWYGAQYEKPDDFAMGRYWVPANEVVDRSGDAGDYFVSFRDIANRDLERTGVFAVLPKVGVGHQAPLIYFANKDRNSVAAFVAERNSFVADFLTRNKMDGSHLSFFILKQLPTLPPSVYSTPCAWMNAAIHVEDWILQHVLELTYTAWDLEAFAQDCGWSGPPFRWDDARRFLLRCELDAAFFHLYLGPNSDWGMANGAAGAESPSSPVPRPSSPALLAAFPTPRDAASYIMDTFPIVKRKDEAKFNGDYRTKRTILEIYDALAEAMKTGTPYQTRLNPAPADASCRHPKKKVGILAFGSLITDPGKELLPKITMRIKTLTPFGVEYGRISQTRGGAPTLVPHEAGTPVEGEILVLDDAVSVEEARNMVWRRERRKEGTGETYFQGTSPNSVLVRDCNESPCVKHVLYTDFNPDGKVAQPQAADLARQAIQSVKAAKEGMDGITYLKNNLASGIKTKLTPDYEAEILKQTKANSLEEAHRKLRLS